MGARLNLSAAFCFTITIAIFFIAAFVPRGANAQLDLGTIYYSDVRCWRGVNKPKDPDALPQGARCGSRPSKCDPSKTIYGKCVGEICKADELEGCDKVRKNPAEAPFPKEALKEGVGEREITLEMPAAVPKPPSPGITPGIDDAFDPDKPDNPDQSMYYYRPPSSGRGGDDYGSSYPSGGGSGFSSAFSNFFSSFGDIFSGFSGGSSGGSGGYSPSGYTQQSGPYEMDPYRPQPMPMAPPDNYEIFKVPSSFAFDPSFEGLSGLFDTYPEPVFTPSSVLAEVANGPPDPLEIGSVFAHYDFPVLPQEIARVIDGPSDLPSERPIFAQEAPAYREPVRPSALEDLARPVSAPLEARRPEPLPFVNTERVPERFLSSFIQGAFDILPRPFNEIPAIFSEILRPPELGVSLAESGARTVNNLINNFSAAEAEAEKGQTVLPSDVARSAQSGPRAESSPLRTIARGLSRMWSWFTNWFSFF